MELVQENNGVLLIRSSKEDNIVLRDVMRVSPNFDYAMWDGLDENELRELIKIVENRVNQEEYVMSHEEFLYLYGILSAAAHGLDITVQGLKKEPVVALMDDFDKIIKELPPLTSIHR